MGAAHHGNGSMKSKDIKRKNRIKTSLDRLLRHPVTDGVVMAAVLISVILLLVEMQLPVDSPEFRRVELAGYGFVGFFIVELSLRWYVAPSTRRFFTEYWLDVLAVIPFFRPARMLRLLRFLRALRLLRLYRFGLITQRFVKGSEPDYVQKIKEEVTHYQGRCHEQVWLAPELYRFLGNLLDDGRVHRTARGKIVAALAYFITPFEAMSRDLLAAEGYLDQVYLCLKVISELEEELPEWLLEEAWEGEGTVKDLIEEDLPLVEAELELDDRESISRYLGLDTEEWKLQYIQEG